MNGRTRRAPETMMRGREKGLGLGGRNISSIVLFHPWRKVYCKEAVKARRGDRLQKRDDVSIRFLYVLSNMYSIRYPSTLFSISHCSSRPSAVHQSLTCTHVERVVNFLTLIQRFFPDGLVIEHTLRVTYLPPFANLPISQSATDCRMHPQCQSLGLTPHDC